MKSLLLTILTFYFSLSQNNWHWKNPYPVGTKINGIYFFDSNNAIAVGSEGTVLSTSNAGITWNYKQISTTCDLQKVEFYNKNFGITVGGNDGAQNGGIFVTTDGGKTWEDHSLNDYALFDIHIFNNSVACVAGFEGILKTTNGGTSWYKTNGSSGWSTSLFFIDDSIGWSTNPTGGILKTTNRGESWTAIATLGWYWTRRIRFATPLIGWIVGNKLYESVGFIGKTTDGGVTWKFQDSSGTGYNDLCIIDSMNVVTVGNNGLIQYTTDGGKMWLYSGTNSNDRFYGIAITDNTLWAVGGGYNHPTIATNQTTTLYSLWNVHKTYFTLSSLNTVTFANDSLGWLAGDDGALFKTTDGGSEWMPLNLFSINFVSSVSPTANTLFIGGDNGELVTSTDGGVTWRILTFAKYQSIRQLQFPSVNRGWFVLSTDYWGGGEIYSTIDAGLTWQKVIKDSFQTPLHASKLQFYDSLHGWYCEPPPVIITQHNPTLATLMGSVGRFFRTTNGGITWNEASFPGLINRFYFISENIGWATVYTLQGWEPFPPPPNDTLYKTTDGGLSWNPHAVIPNLHSANELLFLSENEGWLRINGDVFNTHNGGLSFQKSLNTHILDNQSRLFFTSPNNGWLCGNNGVLMHYSKDMTSVERETKHLNLASFSLYQNYPNPFNPLTTIEFELSKISLVKLTIYNILGQEIATLVHEIKLPGNYKVLWNAQGFSSGTYFYRIQVNNSSMTKKLILLK